MSSRKERLGPYNLVGLVRSSNLSLLFMIFFSGFLFFSIITLLIISLSLSLSSFSRILSSCLTGAFISSGCRCFTSVEMGVAVIKYFALLLALVLSGGIGIKFYLIKLKLGIGSLDFIKLGRNFVVLLLFLVK